MVVLNFNHKTGGFYGMFIFLHLLQSRNHTKIIDFVWVFPTGFQTETLRFPTKPRNICAREIHLFYDYGGDIWLT